MAKDAEEMQLTRLGAEHEPEASFNQLVQDHRPAVERLCGLLLRNDSDAEDAVQQTFLLAYQSLVSGTRPRRPRAWLFAIARHECWARLDQRRERDLPETQASEGLDPSEQAILNTKLQTLLVGIGRLPARQRQVLLLREFGGFSYRQLAATLGISESAVDALLIRARRTLRRGCLTLLPLPYLFSPSRLLQRLLRRVTNTTNRFRASAFTHPLATITTATTVIPLSTLAVLAAIGAPTARIPYQIAGPRTEALRTPTSGSDLKYRVTVSGEIHAKHRGAASLASAPTDSIDVLEWTAGTVRENVEPGSSHRAPRDTPLLAQALQSQPTEERASKQPRRSSTQSVLNGPTPKTPALPVSTPPISPPPHDQSEDGTVLTAAPSIDHPDQTSGVDALAPPPATVQADKPPTKAAEATPAPTNSDPPPANPQHDPPDQDETATMPVTDPDPANIPSGEEPTTPPSPDTTPAPEASVDSQAEHGRPGQRGTVDGVTPGSDPVPPAGTAGEPPTPPRASQGQETDANGPSPNSRSAHSGQNTGRSSSTSR